MFFRREKFIWASHSTVLHEKNSQGVNFLRRFSSRASRGLETPYLRDLDTFSRPGSLSRKNTQLTKAVSPPGVGVWVWGGAQGPQGAHGGPRGPMGAPGGAQGCPGGPRGAPRGALGLPLAPWAPLGPPLGPPWCPWGPHGFTAYNSHSESKPGESSSQEEYA